MWTIGFGWEGALVAFLTFNAVKGVDMCMDAYVSIYEGRTSTPGGDATAEGRGYLLNWFFQMLMTTAAGGYVCRKRKFSYIEFGVLDYLLMLMIATILIWDRVFPNDPLLKRFSTGVMEKTSRRQPGPPDVSRTRITARKD